jgi:DNA-binding NtrC family response regulator
MSEAQERLLRAIAEYEEKLPNTHPGSQAQLLKRVADMNGITQNTLEVALECKRIMIEGGKGNGKRVL